MMYVLALHALAMNAGCRAAGSFVICSRTK